MNARVFLLVLVSALFMGAWNGDQKTMEAAIARRDKLREEAWAAAKQDIGEDLQKSTVAVAVPVSHRQPAKSPEGAALDEREAMNVPVPKGIGAGRYRAVSQSGATYEINVRHRTESAIASRDFYMVDAENGDRWYLIRIQ